MNDSEVSEILRIYDNILLKNLSYCNVCLRAEEERRLVPPRAIKKLVKVLSLPSDYRAQYDQVCFMCEAYAASILRFHAVLKASMSIRELFHSMLLRQRTEFQVRSCLLNNPRAKIAHNAIQKQALESEQLMRLVRSVCRLQHTEVLAIDSEEMTNSSTSAFDFAADSLISTLQNTIPGPRTETVVIIDDEDEPKIVKPTAKPIIDNATATPKLVPIEKLLESPNYNQNIASLLPNQMHVIQPGTDVASNFMLHPIIIENGSFNVPSLSAQLLNGRLVYQGGGTTLLASNAMIAIGSQDKAINLVGNSNNSTISVGNSNNPTISVGNSNNPTISVGNSNNPTISVGNSNNPTISVGNGIVENDNVSSIIIKDGSVTCLSDVENTLDRILKEKADELTNNYKRVIDSCNKTSSRNKKRALDSAKKESEKEKERRIDWEDKIPMDVISFVDAVDPHADPMLRTQHTDPLIIPTSSNLITPDLSPGWSPRKGHPDPQPPGSSMSPMGIITNVHSVGATSMNTQCGSNENVIDLC